MTNQFLKHKPMKLSKAQKEVIQKMREGWINRNGLLLVRHDANMVSKENLKNNVHAALIRKEMLEWKRHSNGTGNIYELTELGKTIPL